MPQIRIEDATTVRKAPGRTATTLIWWIKVDANSFILLRGSPGEFLKAFSLSPFLLRLSLKDSANRAAKKRITAIPENLIRDSIQEASSNLAATPEDASAAI